jgi:hypothetical protein
MIIKHTTAKNNYLKYLKVLPELKQRKSHLTQTLDKSIDTLSHIAVVEGTTLGDQLYVVFDGIDKEEADLEYLSSLLQLKSARNWM